ncbi:MAG: dual specificity protein phosphatase family protein [Anaerolineae bacterium]
MTANLEKPTNPLTRIISLLRVGPRGLYLRFYDQFTRKRTGAPVWTLSRIRSFLYVGGQHYSKGWEQIEAEGITGIINMRETHHDDTAQGIGGSAHLHLATRDNTPVPLDYLHQAADFIAEHKRLSGRVYVHCGVGVGRAPSAAAAYFIKHERMTTAQALDVIRTVRPFIHLTGSQLRQLALFEQDAHQLYQTN